MGRRPANDDGASIPTAERASKTMWFEKNMLDRFMRRVEENGQDAHELFRRFLRTYTEGTHISLDGLDADIREELEAKRQEMGIRRMEPVLESVLSEWARRRSGERKGASKKK